MFLCKKELIILTRTEPIRAVKNPVTSNPGTNDEARRKRAALMTNINMPRVRIVIGRVRTTRIGRTSALRIPNTKAAASAVKNPST